MVSLAIFALLGCSNETTIMAKPDYLEIEKNNIAKMDNMQLCRELMSVEDGLNVNPTTHPEVRDNYRKARVLKQEVYGRGILCWKVMKEGVKPKPVSSLNPRQKRARVVSACNGYISTSRFANPDELLKMCVMGYMDSQEKCDKNIGKFNRESQKITGAFRAEYMEFGMAYRIGCNLKS